MSFVKMNSLWTYNWSQTRCVRAILDPSVAWNIVRDRQTEGSEPTAKSVCVVVRREWQSSTHSLFAISFEWKNM